MPELRVYSQSEFPSVLKWQAVSFIRVVWPYCLYTGSRALIKETIAPELDPVHFTFSHDEVLISYAAVFPLTLQHEGETYRALGVSYVFTYPPFRRRGYGRKIMAAVTDHILSSDADLAALFCEGRRKEFYRQHGWEAMRGSSTRVGTPDSSTHHPMLRMMLFASDRGKQSRLAFTRRPLYVPCAW